ncbi:hypothetical protein [Spirosoma aerolatum]|uniref:hypothetical protein n=1 Tax=Spirosoma aerolatum TaxID=1211326 RepID=UPI0009AD9CE7|nr:hypothetical protein [Spirosoma aerolatum]
MNHLTLDHTPTLAKQATWLTSPFLLFLSYLTISALPGFGQTPGSTAALTQSFDQYRQQALQEKLFVHTDQGFYLTGETMWFKIYYVDGSFHKPLDLSKVAYIELLDKEQKSVLQTKVALTANGGDGTLFLPSSLNSGTYLMRAYTNWMKNFPASYFFEKTITIVNPFKPLTPSPTADVADLDIQFFPEGGNLVDGLSSKVAFRAVNASGAGQAVRGWVLNSRNDTLTTFSAHKFGLGTFTLTPASNTNYRVLLRDETGRQFTRSLPAIQPQGYVMALDDGNPNQLTITVTSNLGTPSTVYLFAHTRQAINQVEAHSIDRQTTFLIDKKALGDGISHLTLFDAQQKPVCERLYFKRPAQPLTIALKTDQPQYASRSKVTLEASIQGATSQVTPSALSVAVYRVDSLSSPNTSNILSYLLMTSDLQGGIESPDYYLQPETPEIAQSTDNLMLTHGWRRFRWTDVLRPVSRPSFPFIPEYSGPTVSGTLTDPATGKPVPRKLTYLSTPGKPIRLYVSLSDTAGRLLYEVQDFYGPKNLIAQTNPQDSLFKLTISNPFSETPSTHQWADRLPTESQATSLTNRSVAMQVQSTYWGDRSIQYKYPAVDSAAFYAKPKESYLLDAYTRFPRMEEVLREYVLGVMPRKRQGHFVLNVLNEPYRAIFENQALVLIDGVPVFDMDKVIEFSPLKVKQLDVVTNFYLMSPAVFSGIISFMTYKGDLAGFPLDNRLVRLDYDGLQLQREFFAPRYDRPASAATKSASSRLPDGRTLLYWNPNWKPNPQGKAQVDFYTSDQTGTYQVDVNGLTREGTPVFQRFTFDVKNTPK